MKKYCLLILVQMSILSVFAQTDASATLAQKIAKLPAFSVVKAPDSTVYTQQQLLPGKPLVIVFFSPDCEHCQKETKELLAYKTELKDIPILMLSPLSYHLVHEFYQEYGLAAMPNVVVATDAAYKLGSMYQLKTFPSVFVYDGTGSLAKAFVGNVAVPAIIEALK